MAMSEVVQQMINDTFDEALVEIETKGLNRAAGLLCLNRYLDTFVSLQGTFGTETALFVLQLSARFETRIVQTILDEMGKEIGDVP